MLQNKKWSTSKIALMAILTALGTILMILEIPLFHPFQLDISDVTVIVSMVLYGPVSGIIIAFSKSVLHLLIKPAGDFGISQLIALTASLVYALPFYFTMLFIRKQGVTMRINRHVLRIVPAVIGTVLLTLLLPLLNYLVFFQLYMFLLTGNVQPHDAVLAFALGTIPANLVKGISLSVVFYLLSFRLEKVSSLLNVNDNEVFLASIGTQTLEQH